MRKYLLATSYSCTWFNRYDHYLSVIKDVLNTELFIARRTLTDFIHNQTRIHEHKRPYPTVQTFNFLPQIPNYADQRKSDLNN